MNIHRHPVLGWEEVSRPDTKSGKRPHEPKDQWEPKWRKTIGMEDGRNVRKQTVGREGNRTHGSGGHALVEREGGKSRRVEITIVWEKEIQYCSNTVKRNTERW